MSTTPSPSFASATSRQVTPEVTKRELFHRAADLLEEFGWCQHVPARSDDGSFRYPQDSDAVSFCITGSIERAVFDLCGINIRTQGVPAFLRMHQRRRDGSSDRHSPTSVDWNNDPERTRAEVVARLRELAEAFVPEREVVAS